MKRMIAGLLSALLCQAVVGTATAQNVEYVSSALWAGVSDVEVVGGHAFCALVNGLGILDVADPAEPVFVSQLYTQGYVRSVDVAGDYACLASGASGPQDGRI